MKPIYLFTIVLIAAAVARGADPGEVIAEHYFPPELIEAASEEIKLPADLKEKLREDLSRITPQFKELQERVQIEMRELGELSTPAQVDQKALLAQLDKLQAAEKELRRLHLQTLATIKNQLSSEQQEQLRRWKQSHPDKLPHEMRAQFRQRLERKVQQVHQGMEAWQTIGKDPSAIGKIMQEFSKFMTEGRVKEAETTLDRAIATLKEQN